MLAFLHDVLDDKLAIFTRSFATDDCAGQSPNLAANSENLKKETDIEKDQIEYVIDNELMEQMKALGLPVAFGSSVQEQNAVAYEAPEQDLEQLPESGRKIKTSRKRQRQNASRTTGQNTIEAVTDYASLHLYLEALSEEQQQELWTSWSEKCPQFSSEADHTALLSQRGHISSGKSVVDGEWLIHCNNYLASIPTDPVEQDGPSSKSDYLSQRLQLLGYRYDSVAISAEADRYSLRLGQKLSKIKKDRAQLNIWKSGDSNRVADEDGEGISNGQHGDTSRSAGTKYEAQKFRLFSRFDEGIRLDEESWFSVTPEKIAAHHAQRCQCDIAIDAFCGAGGDAIQLAFTCELVIAIDKDPLKIEMARHNASIYGVADRIEFIVGDFFDVAPYLHGDMIYLSPPWGGPQYSSSKKFDIFSMMPIDVKKMFATARRISPNIAFFVPRNVDVLQLVSLAAGSTNREENSLVEVEQNFFGQKLKAITAYYGELVNPKFAKKAVRLQSSISSNNRPAEEDERFCKDSDAFSEFMFASSKDLPIFQ